MQSSDIERFYSHVLKGPEPDSCWLWLGAISDDGYGRFWFGYRFIADELAEQGFTASERRVWRLCSQQRLWSVFAKKRGLNRRAGPPVHDDLVERDFTATAPNEL